MHNGRIEKKYIINNSLFIKHLLSANFAPDASYFFNYIFTLHFDTHSLDSYYDKLNGAPYKNKIRARWYSDADKFFIPKKIYLENKTKNLDRSFKYRIQLDLPDNLRREIFNPRLWQEIVARKQSQLRFNLNKYIYPVMISCYKRHRFNDPFSGNNISLDDCIGMYQINPSMACFGYSYPELTERIVEVKGQSGHLPICLENLGVLSLSSFSKYEALLTKYYRR